MKYLVALMLLFTISIEAQAQQTADCAGNFKDLQDIVSRKFSDVKKFRPLTKFLGTWQMKGNKEMALTINSRGNFDIPGKGNFSLCPQGNGCFFAYHNIFRNNSGYICAQGSKTVTVSNGQGEFSKAHGTYVNVGGGGV